MNPVYLSIRALLFCLLISFPLFSCAQWGNTSVMDLVGCSDGGSYVAGSFIGGLTLSGNRYIGDSADTYNYSVTGRGYVCKVDTAGGIEWVRQFYNNYNQTFFLAQPLTRVSVDHEGNILLAISPIQNLIWGGNNIASCDGQGTAIIKLDTNGTLLWSEVVCSGGKMANVACSSDTLGNIWLTGKFQTSPLEVPGLPNVSGGNSWHLFAAKFDTAGTAQWVKTIPGPGSWSGFGDVQATVDQHGELYIGSDFGVPGSNASISFAGDNLGGLGEPKVWTFVAKYDGAGNEKWLKGFENGSVLRGLTVNDRDELFGLIYFSDTLGLDNFPSMVSLSPDLSLVRMDTGGTINWAKQAAPASSNSLYSGSLECGPEGGPVVAGVQEGVIDFTDFASQGIPFMQSRFVAQWDSAGMSVCLTSSQLAANEYPRIKLGVGGNGYLYTGSWEAPNQQLTHHKLQVVNPACQQVVDRTWINVLADMGVGINPAQELIVSIFPNPTEGLLHLRGELPEGELRVLNMQGKELMKLQLEMGAEEEYILDLSELAGGMYLLDFNRKGAHDYTKIIKK